MVHAITAQPLGGPRVRLDGDGREVVTGPDGGFRSDRHALSTASDGFLAATRVVELTGAAGVCLELSLSPVLVYSESVSVRAPPGIRSSQLRR